MWLLHVLLHSARTLQKKTRLLAMKVEERCKIKKLPVCSH